MALTLLQRLKRVRKNRPYGQFGQKGDRCTDNGSLGCTHTVWQYIAFVYKGKLYTHDQLSRLSGYPCGGGPTNRGMRITESQKLVRALKLPYIYKANLTSGQLLKASKRGPVLFAIRYGDWPNWKGYRNHYRPRPWARPRGRAGRNQFTGFYGSHAVALLGFRRIIRNGKFIRNACAVLEPNHASPARPEKVPYDIVTQSELNKAYRATVTKLRWPSTMAFIPTKAPTFPGGLR